MEQARPDKDDHDEGDHDDEGDRDDEGEDDDEGDHDDEYHDEGESEGNRDDDGDHVMMKTITINSLFGSSNVIIRTKSIQS